MDDTFSVATGWLGWLPEVALNTPIPQIMLAHKGLIKKETTLSPFFENKKESKPKESNTVITKAKAFASFFAPKGKG